MKRRIVEAFEDPSGLVHPERRQAFASRQHPLGKNPAFPEQGNYEEQVASKRWQKLLRKAQQYYGVPLAKEALPVIQKKLLASLELMDGAEERYREELEALAIEIVFELPEFKVFRAPYERGEIELDAKLVKHEEIDLSGAATSAEIEQQEKPVRHAEDEEVLQRKIKRRHLTNAFIQGSAVSNNYAFEMGGAQLDRIHPDLRKAYGMLMTSTDIGYWMFPQSAVIQAAKQLQVGSAQVKQGEEGKPIVVARGIHFPVLIQELIKGLSELASMQGLPEDPEERKEVINQADLIDAEAWHMMLGPELWDSFMQAVDSENEREVAMHLYSHIQRMGDDEFNAFIKAILSGTPEGRYALRSMAIQVKKELRDSEELGESGRIVRSLLDD